MKTKLLLKKIADDRTHGATELTILAIESIYQLVRNKTSLTRTEFREIQRLMVDLAACRPSMAALNNCLDGLLQDVTHTGGAPNIVVNLQQLVTQACSRSLISIQRAQSSAVNNMVAILGVNDVIMTHSISSAVKSVFHQLSRSETHVHAIVTESRPGNEGRLLAEFLAALGIKTTYITEAQIDLWMPRVDKVVVGADAVLADGSIINKCGSCLMALSARYHSVPFYVCAERFKQKGDNRYELEQMDVEELNIRIPGVTPSNIYFEKIPAELITDWLN